MELSSEILEQLIRRVMSEKSEITLVQFRDEYIEAIKHTHSDSYLRSVKYTFLQLLKYSDNLKLVKYEPRYIEKFILDKFKISKYTASLYYRTLKAAFSKAVEWNYISVNPFTRIKFPKFQKNRPAFISIDELNTILKYLPNQDLADFYLFAFYTGCRLSEIINLQWSSINLNDSIIQIGSKEFITKGKKVRTIPICNQVYEILIKRFPKILRQKNNYVFTKYSGFCYSADYISKTFKKAVRASGMNDDVHFHTLRHSTASSLIQKGVSLYIIKELLGHSSITQTEIYSHLDITSLRDAVNKFNNTSMGTN